MHRPTSCIKSRVVMQQTLISQIDQWATRSLQRPLVSSTSRVYARNALQRNNKDSLGTGHVRLIMLPTSACRRIYQIVYRTTRNADATC